MMGVVEDRIAELEQDREVVIRQYQETKQQARSTLNLGDVPRLEEQANDLKMRYEELNRQIEQLRTGTPLKRTQDQINRLKAELHNEWESTLHWLDYGQQENKFHELVRVEGHEAVLLFIRHRMRMKADLYIKRIRNCVLDEGRLRPYTEDFTKQGRIDARRFIELLQSKLHIQPSTPDFESAVQGVIQTLKGSVTRGQILYIEIHMKPVSEDFFSWFLDAFWGPLVDAIFPSNRGVSLIVILTTEAAQMHEEWCCEANHFERKKYVEIELRKWKKEEIKSWINQYLNASLEKEFLPTQDASTLASQVYTDSDEGTPLWAHNYILCDILTQVVD